MPSLRSRFWSSTISKIIDNAPEINHPNDIRRDFSEDRISFFKANWRKDLRSRLCWSDQEQTWAKPVKPRC